MTNMPAVSTLIDGLRWRYQNHVEPYVVVHRNPSVFLGRCVRNTYARVAAAPVVYVCANPSNAGDYASHLGVKKIVGRRGAEMFCDPVAVAATMRALSRGARPRVPWSAVVVGGGGLLQRAFDEFWERALDLDVPLVLFGVGANEAWPQRRATDGPLLTRIAQKATALHVRDEFTRGLLAERTNAPVTVGICPSVHYLADHKATLVPEQTHLLHVVHDVDLGFAGVDSRDLRSRLRATARRMHLEYDELDHTSGMSAGLLKRYARAAVVVSSRLHGAIFASALGKPCVAIDCDRKTGAFLDTHATRTPRVRPQDGLAMLAPESLSTVIRDFTPYDYSAGVAANSARMTQILGKLNLAS